MSDPLIMASLAYSGKGNAALVAVRVGDQEVSMDAKSAHEFAAKINALATEAEMETALVDFLAMKTAIEEIAMTPAAARKFVSIFRQHRTDLRGAPDVTGRALTVEDAE